MARTIANGLVIAAVATTGCTTFGLRLGPPPVGPSATIPVCTNAPELVARAWAPEATRSGLDVKPVPVPLVRRGASLIEMLDEVEAQTRTRCARTLAVFPLRADDLVLAGLLGIYGITRYDAESGYGLALPFAHAIRHELLHVLGCDHGLTRAACDRRIEALKRAHAEAPAALPRLDR